MSFVAIFFGVLLVGGFINYFIGQMMFISGLSFSNRILGFIFGIFRGTVIGVILIYVGLMSPLQAEPVWKASPTLHYFLPYAKKLDVVLSDRIKEWKKKIEQELEKRQKTPKVEA